MAVIRFAAVLSPTIVAANTTAEQSFVAGPGNLDPVASAVQVTKFGAQSGLGIAGARVIDATHIGILFINATAAGITPTAAEMYQFLVVT